MINQQIQGKVTGQHAWVIQLMSEPKFSPRLKEISPTTMARVTLSKTRNMFGLYMLHN